MSLKLEIAIPQRKILEEESVDSVTLPGSEGELGILPEHVPLITTLDTGILSYQTGNRRQALAIHWGYAQVEGNRVTVLAELAEKADEIDAGRAQIAEQKAREVLKGHFGEDEVEIQRMLKYESKLKRALVRQSATEFQ